MNPHIQASWDRIRAALIHAREKAGLDITDLTRGCRCAKSTLRHLEAGDTYSRADTLLAYAHNVGLEIAAVDKHLARLLTLDRDDTVAVLRAARVAAEGQRLTPLQSRRVTQALDKINPGAPHG